MRRLVAGIVVPLLLSVAACGGDSSDDGGDDATADEGTISDITVTGSPDQKPTIDFNAPLSFKETESEVVDEGPGDGLAITPTSGVTVDYVGVNARDGAEFDSSWEGGQPATFTLDQVIPGFATGLEGAHAGDRVLLAIASKDGYDPTGNGSTILEGDSLVFVVDVRDVTKPPKPVEALEEAEGKPVKSPADVPTLVLDKDGHPEKFEATKQTPKKVTELGVHPLIQGTGPKVESGQTITVEYVGQLYPDGEVFDESWSNDQPISFPIGVQQVIPGWDQGLVGQNVGSRVVLVIPSDLGYGAQGSGETIPPDSDLIFVVDILAAA